MGDFSAFAWFRTSARAERTPNTRIAKSTSCAAGAERTKGKITTSSLSNKRPGLFGSADRGAGGEAILARILICATLAVDFPSPRANSISEPRNAFFSKLGETQLL